MLDATIEKDTFESMAATTLNQARSVAFRLAPDDQVELANSLIDRVSHLPAAPPKKRATAKVARNIKRIAKAIGDPLTGRELDARLENAVSGREKGVPTSTAIRSIRKRLGL